MKMKIPVRRSCITLIVLSAFVDAITANENETSTVAGRKGRVSGRIIKLYSGYKPDPVICIEEGFRADPVHCSVFYRCLKAPSGKFTVFKFQCGPGTVYDPETEVCNHPSSTKRSECSGIKSHVEQDNENDIEQHELPSPISTIVPVYTSTANNNARYTTKVPQLSSSGQLKPSTENDYINSFTTSSSPYQLGLTTKEVQDINHNLLSYPWTDYKNTTQQRITSSTAVLEKAQPCISDGFMGDTKDCKKFYRCVSNLRGGFIRYEFVCSEPTVWDDHMQSCNHPWAVRSGRCGRFGINSEMSYVSNNMATEPTEVNYGVKFSETPTQESSEISKPIEPTANYGDRLSSASEKNQMSYGPFLVDYTTTPNHDKSTGTEGNIQSDDVHNNYNFGQKTTIQAIYSTNKLAENSDAQFAESGRNFICTQSGFFGDFINCKKFYRCVENGKGSFTKYEFTCSQGTVWDKKLEACNYAWAVKECGGASAVESLTTVDTFTSSTNTIPTILSENVDNGYINHSNQEIEPSTTITVSTPVSLISSTAAASNLIEKECTETGFVGDKNDCKKFYRCVENGRGSFTKFEYICGDGTLWDQTIEACNHAWAVRSCNSVTPNSTMHTTRVTTAKTLTTSFLIQSTTPAKVQENNDYNVAYGPPLDTASSTPDVDLQKTTLAPIINQKNNCESTGFMGDSNDCKKFYRCVSNGQSGFIKYEFSCGEGTVWDPEIEACNHAWAVKNCGSSIALKDEVTSSSITYSSTKPSDATVTTSISSIQTSTQPEEISDSGYGQQQIVSTKRPYLETTTLKQSYDQTNNCHVSGFIGDMNNCNKFYRCVDNGNGGFIRHEFSCGEGTVWDPEIEACNHAWAVKHCGGPSKENHLTSSTPNVIESNNEYVTQNYVDIHNNADNFTETTRSTVSTVTTITVTSSSNECKSSGFMGDNIDCRKFYRCVDNGNGGFVKHEFMCGEGTVWDSKIEACNHKWAVEKCGGNSHTESLKTTTHSSQPTSPVTESLTTSSLSVTYTTPTMSTHPVNIVPSNEDSGCSSEGYFAYPNDCKKFYRCVTEGNDGYTKYEFSCAEGTAWDTHTQSCNYISKVETCSSNQHQINPAETKPVHDEPITESDKTTTSASTTSTSTTSASTAPAYTSSTSTTSKSTMSASITPESTTSAPTTSANATSLTTVRQNTCKEEGYFGDTNDCKNFYRCVYENDRVLKKYDFTCGDGTIWDQDLITCNHPHDVKNPSCKSIPESTSPVSTTSTTTDYNETNSSTNLHHSTTNKPSSTIIEATSNKNDTNSNCSNSTTENPNNANVTCPKAGYYADSRNCKKFYRCVDWENNGKKFSVYHFECADGTIWDPALETCNHEDSVYPPRNCHGTHQQNENTTETSSTTEQTTTTTNKAESTNTSPEPTKTSAQTTTTSKNPSTQTTQSSTTEKSTSQPSTTQVSTTNKSTTQSSTTEDSTTQSSTTEESTTHSSTTQESTTQSSTTQESTTQSSTVTAESTTQSSSSAESTIQTSTTQSSTGEETTTRSSTTQESTTQSSTTQESTTQSSTTAESTTQSSTTEESTTQTSTTQSSTTDEPTTQSSTTDESTTQSSTTEEPTTHSSTTEESTTQSSTTNEQTTLEQQFHSTTTETDKEKTTTTQMTTSTLDQTSTTEPSTTATDASSSSTTEHYQESTTATSTNEKCPDTAADQSLFVCPSSFKRHPKYCNLFYQCTEDNDSHEIKIAVFNCPNNTVYDESKIQCVEEKKSSKKCNGKISQKHKVEGLGATQMDLFVVTKGSMACEYSGHFSFEKHTECSSSLLKCELTKSGHLRGFVYRCPDGFVYWNISRRCEPLKKVRDCKRSSYQWERRYDIPLERFNIAS